MNAFSEFVILISTINIIIVYKITTKMRINSLKLIFLMSFVINKLYNNDSTHSNLVIKIIQNDSSLINTDKLNILLEENP